MNKKPPVRQPPNGRVAHSVEEQFAQLDTQFQQLKAQVRQAQQLSSLGTAAATFAHEVNNLLTPILSYAMSAVGADDMAFKNKALSVTIKNVQMLIAMSDRVLEISAAKSAKCESVSVKQVVKGALESLCRDVSKDGVTLTINVDDSMVVWADPLQLQQVLFNLFLNAREAMASSHSGRLMISAHVNDEQGDQMVIEICNSGPPIPPDLLPYIFDPLQTSKPINSEGKPRCGGLGLALCNDLIEENNGTIRATSDAVNGTTFTITLPMIATT